LTKKAKELRCHLKMSKEGIAAGQEKGRKGFFVDPAEEGKGKRHKKGVIADPRTASLDARGGIPTDLKRKKEIDEKGKEPQ